MGLRERKKQETRDALSWAAIRLIVERGYDKVLVEDIATAAGVSPRTFNNYYSSKAEAVAARHLDRLRKVADALRERPAEEPFWDAMTAASLSQTVPGPEVTAQPEPDPVAWAAGLRQMLAVPAVQAEISRTFTTAEAELAAAIAERTKTDPVQDVYPRLVASVVLAATGVVQNEYTRQDRPKGSIQDLLADAIDQIRAGLPPPA